MAPRTRPAPSGERAAPTRADDGRPRPGRAADRAANRAAGSGRRRAARPRPAPARGRAADLTVAAGGVVALVAFLVVPHVTAPDTGPLTVPALIRLTTAAEPNVRLLWLVGAGAALTAVLGGIAAALRRRGARSTLLAATLPATAVPILGYLTVGVAALGPAGPSLAPGFALVGFGLLVAFVAAIAGLMTPGP